MPTTKSAQLGRPMGRMRIAVYRAAVGGRLGGWILHHFKALSLSVLSHVNILVLAK